MTEFEEDLKNKINSEKVPMYFTQSGCSMTRKTYIETSWIFDTYKNWRSDEAFQKMVELGGSYVLANKNLIEENKRLTQEILVDLKSELEHQDLPVVKDFVAKWIEYIKEKDNNARGLLTDLDNMPDDVNEWLFFQENDDNINLILRAWLDGYTVEKQLFYLRNKLTGMYLYKKPLGGYGEDPASYIKDLTNDFKFTQKEIDGMDAQSYEKKDEYKGE